MNKFLKYIIYFLLGLMITLILKKDKNIEGFRNPFIILSRVMGSKIDTEGNKDYLTKNIGCKNYVCDNKNKYTYSQVENLINSSDNATLTALVKETFDISNDFTSDRVGLAAEIERKIGHHIGHSDLVCTGGSYCRFKDERTDEMNPEMKDLLILNIFKKFNNNHYVSRDYSDDIRYKTCNNSDDFLSDSTLGERCTHEICCFNTACGSEDAKGKPVSESDLDLNSGNCSEIESENCNGVGECVNFEDGTDGPRHYCNCPTGFSGSNCETIIRNNEGCGSGDNKCPDKCTNNTCSCYDGYKVKTPFEDDTLSDTGSNVEGSMCFPPRHTCPVNSLVKEYSNCKNIEECRNNYNFYCCTDTIDPDTNDGIETTEPSVATWSGRTNAYNTLRDFFNADQSNLHKLLTLKSGDDYIPLDKWDYYSLLNE